MTIAETMLGEFDHEMGTTRTVLERVPDADVAWKPHPKSYSLGDLALHLANIPTWIVPTIRQSELDLNPPGGSPYVVRQFTSTGDLVRTFEENVGTARHHLATAPDAGMKEPWTLLSAGNVILTLPRVAVLRSFIMNHMILHRAQLTVYLRLRDVPLPSVYGPTADMQASR